MKYFSLIITTLFILYADFAYSQPDTIFLDYKGEMRYPVNFRPKHGKSYVLKLSNVNLNIYKVESSNTTTNYNTDVPTIFSGIKLPGYLNLGLPEIKDNDQNNNLELLMLPDSNRVNIKALILQHFNTIKESVEIFNKAGILDQELLNIQVNCRLTHAQIDSTAKARVKQLTAGTIVTTEAQANQLRTLLENALKNAEEAINMLNELIPLHLEDVNGEIKSNIINIVKPWEKNPLPKTHINYKKFATLYEKSLLRNDLLKDYIDSLNILVSKNAELVQIIHTVRKENRIHVLIEHYLSINPNYYTFFSDPVKANADELKFSLKISTDKEISCHPPRTQEFNKSYFVKGGFKVDFSTGLFLNTGSEDFLGRELKYKTINDSVVQIHAADGGKRLLLSIGALMHLYFRSGNNFNLALSPGLSTTTAFDGLNFHLGLSGIIGKKERVVITAGFTLREALILDKSYEYDVDYDKRMLPEAPPTIKVFPISGGFFAITYNLSKLKAK